MECFALSRPPEGFGSSTKRFSLLSGEGSLESSFISLVPLGSIKGFVLVSNIIELIRKVINVLVLIVNSVLGFFEVSLEFLSDISPFFHESFTCWGSQEFLVKLFDLVDLLGMSKSLEGCFQVSNWFRVLDFLKGHTDISGLLLDGSLSSFGDFDLKFVDEFFIKLFGGDDSEENGKGSEFHFGVWVGF